MLLLIYNAKTITGIQIKLFDNHAGEGAYLIYSHDEENVWSLKLVVYNANSTTEAIVATLHESITYISVALDKLNNQIVIKNINKMRDYEQTAFDSAVILTDENGDPLIDEEDRQVVEIVEIGALNKTTITSKKDGILIKAYSTSIGENNAYVDKAITEESQI